MAQFLPIFPRLVLAYFEPLSLVAGAVGAIRDPEWFVAEQIASTAPAKLSGNALVVCLQLGSIYFLLFMIGIAVLWTPSTPPATVRNYVVALAIADLGHLAVTYYVLGYETFFDVSKWNAMAWGNIGTTTFLFVTRMGYLTGIFGPGQVATLVNQSSRKKVA